MEKKQLDRKHVGKKTTEVQKEHIEKLQKEMIATAGRPVAWIEAKHAYFEKLEGMQQKEKAPKKKGPMTIAETKLGVTMVLSKEDCKTIGIEDTRTTREAIQEIRNRLGFPEKKK